MATSMGFKERLIHFLRESGISQAAFADAIGVARSYISAMRKAMDSDKLAKVVECYPQLNISWLLTGKGDMLNDPISSTRISLGGIIAGGEYDAGELLSEKRAAMLNELNRMYKEHQEMLLGAQRIFEDIVRMNVELTKIS